MNKKYIGYLLVAIAFLINKLIGINCINTTTGLIEGYIILKIMYGDSNE